MHTIQRPEFIITIGEHFFLDEPIHNQTAKFYCIKFEGKVYEIQFFFLRVCIEIKKKKILAGSHCMRHLNPGGQGLNIHMIFQCLFMNDIFLQRSSMARC